MPAVREADLMEVITVHVIEGDMHNVQIWQELLVPGIRHGEIRIDLRADTPIMRIFQQRHNHIIYRRSPKHRLSPGYADGLQMLHFVQALQHIGKRKHVPFLHGQAVPDSTVLTAHIT
ncbi:hypothetical protein D3C75_388230 [compost metagenome]